MICFLHILRISGGNTDEWWFSPIGWPDRQIHPGMGAHISMMYIVAYNFLNIMATTCCDRLEIGPDHIYDSSVHDMSALRLNQMLAGEPRPKIATALPPDMTKDLSLDNISVKRRKAENASIDLAFNASECTTLTFYLGVEHLTSSKQIYSRCSGNIYNFE
mmetsp:Transcript_24400/g.36386  ORF Transcript_24400/g.36386 Transcript_24400/m.36386 type:complete len:161 (-) Transcript_24400:187-669(-)